MSSAAKLWCYPQNKFYSSMQWLFMNAFQCWGILLIQMIRVYCACNRCDERAVSIWATSRQNQQNDCAPSEVSDQSQHPPSLIRVFAVRMEKAWILSYPLSHSEDSDQTGRMPRLIWVFAGHTVILLVLSWGSSYTLWFPFLSCGLERQLYITAIMFA